MLRSFLYSLSLGAYTYGNSITGIPEMPMSDKIFVVQSDVIKNLAKEELPVFDFFKGEFDIDGYKFETSANECYIYTSTGETESSIPPLTEYNFIIYAGIPNELANSNSIEFRFGFFDMFDNKDFYGSFDEDVISLCTYQYSIKVK